MAVNKNDFIEIEYTGRLKETNEVFDTTSEAVAKKHNIFHGQKFSPIVICVGEGHILLSMENEMIGKEIGKEYEIALPAEKAFGKKTTQLIQLIATNKFLKDGIKPMPGLQVNIDGMYGTVKTVTGGRTLVDFNHPLSGKDVVYTVKINKLVIDTKEKVQGLVDLQFGKENATVDLKDGEATIKHKEFFAKEIEQKFSDILHRLIPELKKVVFVNEENNVKTKEIEKSKADVKEENEKVKQI